MIEAAFHGTVCKTPELKRGKSGKSYTILSVATEDDDRDGNKKTTWVTVTVFGEAAEKLCSRELKGARIYCEGYLTLESWTDQAGKERNSLKLVAWKAERHGASAIGRNRDRGERKAGNDFQAPLERDGGARDFNDALPF